MKTYLNDEDIEQAVLTQLGGIGGCESAHRVEITARSDTTLERNWEIGNVRDIDGNVLHDCKRHAISIADKMDVLLQMK